MALSEKEKALVAFALRFLLANLESDDIPRAVEKFYEDHPSVLMAQRMSCPEIADEHRFGLIEADLRLLAKRFCGQGD